MLTTTLNEILKHGPCVSGWVKLTGQSANRDKWVGDDEPLTFADILESIGLYGAMWAYKVLSDEDLKRFKLFICDIAERALIHVPEGEYRPRIAIETSRKYINGEATIEELNKARDDAYNVYATAYDSAACCIAHAASYVANPSATAVYRTANDACDAAADADAADAADAELEEQIKLFKKFINE